jgi:integrase
MDLEISCDELRHCYAAPQRSRWVPEDPQQKVDRHKTGVLGSSHGKGFALPSLPSDRRSVSRAFWATGALSKTPVFRNHLDILIYFFDSGDRRGAANGESRFLFVSERGAPLSIDGAQKLIERLGDKAGIPHLHIHMLRHSAGYALAGRGVDTRTLQAFMGHRNISNTTIYTAIADKRLRTIWHKR